METKFTLDINGTKMVFNSLEQAQNYMLAYNNAQMQIYMQQSQAQMQMSKIQQREAERKRIRNSRKQKLNKLNW
jgi:hypothetical protein